MKNNLTLVLLVWCSTILSAQNMPYGFVYLDNVIDNLEVDLRYYSEDNFVGTTIDGYHISKVIITKEAANALVKVKAELIPLGYSLKVFDAYRPQRAVDHFVRWAKVLEDTLPKSKYYPEVPKSELFDRGYIASKSGHTRGSTVDLTLVDANGQELDMGTSWDFFGKESWPSSESVSNEQKKNRLLLREVMIKHGFKPYEAEWWHFTLKDEPYPSRYFDFPIKEYDGPAQPETKSLLGEDLYSTPPSAWLQKRYDSIASMYEADPNAETLIWYGRFVAYSGRYREAIDVYEQGQKKYPDDPRFLRHMGHRYITLREFDKAIAVLEEAATMIEGTENEIEPDGMPNAMNIPVSSLHGNIWYHLGLAYYLKHDFENALRAYEECKKSLNNNDNLVSSSNWLYMINKRLGRDKAADQVMDDISADLEIIENFTYHEICLYYKGEKTEGEIVGSEGDFSSNDAINYAIGNWYYYNGEKEKARVIFERIVSGSGWGSFGFIAAEADLSKF